MIRLNFKIELKGDYHIGSGEGSNAWVDSFLFRDTSGLLVIRGTTLEGLFRESAWRLFQLTPLHTKYPVCEYSTFSEGASFCGQWDAHQKYCPLCQLFGSPKLSKSVMFSTARLYPGEYKMVEGDAGKSDKYPIHQYVAIDYLRRHAEDKKLFSREVGPASEFYFFVDVPRWEDAVLLVAVARNIRGLGASRRRGLGECLIQLTRMSNAGRMADPASESSEMLQDKILEKNMLDSFAELWLENHLDTDDSGTTRATSSLTNRVVQHESINTVRAVNYAQTTNEPWRVRVVAQLEEPAMVVSHAAGGNQYEGLDYFPGTTVRGAFAALAVAFGHAVETGATYNAFLNLFARDEVSFLPWYPMKTPRIDKKCKCAAPSPLDLFVCKEINAYVNKEYKSPHRSITLATESEVDGGNELFTCDFHSCGADRINLDGYVVIQSKPEKMTVPKRVEMHNRISALSPRSGNGALYAYQLIDEGVYFVGEIQGSHPEVWEEIRLLCNLPNEKVPFDLRLGRSSRRGYGRTKAFWESVPTDTPPIWANLSLNQRVHNDHAQGNPITMLFVTDVILRDRFGRHAHGLNDVQLLQEEMETIWTTFGLTGIVPKLEAIEIEYSRCRVIDGFHAWKGMPRYRDEAVVAGSIVRLRFTPTDNEMFYKALDLIEKNGIGQRRAEGFGRAVFNPQFYLEGDKKVVDENDEIDVSPIIDDYRIMGKKDDIRLLREELNTFLSYSEFNWIEDISDDTWIMVSRVIMSWQGNTLAEVRNHQMEELGKHPVFLRNELKGRTKVDFFTDEQKGRAGLNLLRRIADFLLKRTAKPGVLVNFWGKSELQDIDKTAILLEMWVERINVFARQGREGAPS